MTPGGSERTALTFMDSPWRERPHLGRADPRTHLAARYDPHVVPPHQRNRDPGGGQSAGLGPRFGLSVEAEDRPCEPGVAFRRREADLRAVVAAEDEESR